jgi:uncharacterized protein
MKTSVMSETATVPAQLSREGTSFEAKLSEVHVWPVVPLMLATYIAAIVLTPRSVGPTEAALIKECAAAAVVIAWWLRTIARHAPTTLSALGPSLGVRNWARVLFCVVSLLLARAGLLLLLDILRSLELPLVEPYTYSGPQRPWPVAAAMLTTCVVLPVVEELAFRSALFRGWRTRLGATWAALASCGLFAVFHADPVGSFLSALVWVLLYVRAGTLWAPVAAHCLNNLFAMTWQLGLGVWSFKIVAGDARQIVALLGGALGMVGLAFFARASWPHLSASLPPDPRAPTDDG